MYLLLKELSVKLLKLKSNLEIKLSRFQQKTCGIRKLEETLKILYVLVTLEVSQSGTSDPKLDE